MTAARYSDSSRTAGRGTLEFQTDESIAPAIISTYLQSGIPMIAIESPHPGVDHYHPNDVLDVTRLKYAAE